MYSTAIWAGALRPRPSVRLLKERRRLRISALLLLSFCGKTVLKI
jgi:hypothetical protein